MGAGLGERLLGVVYVEAWFTAANVAAWRRLKATAFFIGLVSKCVAKIWRYETVCGGDEG